ncbi:MAG TPA: D-alanyl-D-alanine carboxypeptidase/D-alanyl-D-alanine-endopeptidase [Pyrinomonadaceae bacterium]|nr:D-alanyl-D-alanine carboxypeptidase/D-alanyl-D-alanine-endopeptidase [Pyrinomonadaceae bacterium]
MPNKSHSIVSYVAATLVSLSLMLGVTFGVQPQRQRRVGTSSTQPTPTPSPTPIIAPTPAAAETATPEASPSPTPDVAAIRVAATTRSLSELQSRITQILRKPDFDAATIGVKVASLTTGKVLFEENANKLLRPASNMKLYSVSAALDRLGPDYHFVTSVYAHAKPDAAGIISGDLIIYGRGDPSLAARFNSGDYFKGINDLASRIAAAGVKRVEGDLVGDETYFVGPQYGSGWEWDDLQWWYGAEVSALTVNDNSLDLFVKPGAQVGAPAVITTGPPDPLLRIINKVVTAERKTKRDLMVHRGLAADELEVSGSIALDDKGYTGGIGISKPALLFAYLVRSALAERGVIISGKTRTIAPEWSGGSSNSTVGDFSIIPFTFPKNSSGQSYSITPRQALVEIAQLQSPPLSVIAAQTLKPSQNLYTELILRTLGKVAPLPLTAANANRTSEEAGLEVVKAFLKDAGVMPPALVLSDGSGLSRNDMVTAAATVQLLTYMHSHRYAMQLHDALPIAGVDGTLRNRLKGTPAENNLRAKTGSLSSAASLSGYVKDAAGEDLVFSIMFNNYPEDADIRGGGIDPIATLLAAFTGKTQ